MDKTKPYTVEDLDPLVWLYDADRLRATVLALAQVTRERDEARAEVERMTIERRKLDHDLKVARQLQEVAERFHNVAVKERDEARRVSAIALASEVDARAEVERLRSEHRLAMQAHDCTHGDTPGLIHCPLDRPCTTHDNERLREALREVLPFVNAVHFTAETMRQGLEAAERARAALAGNGGAPAPRVWTESEVRALLHRVMRHGSERHPSTLYNLGIIEELLAGKGGG